MSNVNGNVNDPIYNFVTRLFCNPIILKNKPRHIGLALAKVPESYLLSFHLNCFDKAKKSIM